VEGLVGTSEKKPGNRLKNQSGRLIGVEAALCPGDFITQGQTPFFQPPQHQLVNRNARASSIDQGVKVTMLDAQLNEAPLRRVQVGFQGRIAV
jgi:hypothetical protein